MNSPTDSQRKGKGANANANDDTLGENTEQTPLAKEVNKERKDKEKKDKPKKGGQTP